MTTDAKVNSNSATAANASEANSEVQPDADAIRGYLEMFSAATGARELQLVALPEKDENEPGAKLAPPREFKGSVDAAVAWAVRMSADAGNARCLCLFPNEGQGRTNAEVTGTRCVVMDWDSGQAVPKNLPLRPSLIVQSKNGQHGYFFTDVPLSPAELQVVLKGAVQFGADPVAAKLSQPFRMPGTVHRKDRTNPFLVRIAEIGGIAVDADGGIASHGNVTRLPKRSMPPIPPHVAARIAERRKQGVAVPRIGVRPTIYSTSAVLAAFAPHGAVATTPTPCPLAAPAPGGVAIGPRPKYVATALGGQTFGRVWADAAVGLPESDARRPYIVAAVSCEIDAMAAMKPGSGRNGALYTRAAAVANFADDGQIDAGVALAALLTAGEAQGRSKHGAANDSAAVRGWQFGLTRPRTAPAYQGSALASVATQTAGVAPQAPANGATATASLLNDPWAKPNLNAPYIIKGLLGPGDDGILYGASGSLKTFVALDMGYALARGESRWCDMRLGKGVAVIVVAYEGEGGLWKRLSALRREHGDGPDGRAPDRLRWVTAPLPFFKDPPNGKQERSADEKVVAAVEELKAATGAEHVLVIIDTLARASAGHDENAATDMALFEARMKSIRQRTGAATLLVHHLGKDASKDMRGSSALRSNCAAALRIDATDNEHVRVLSVQKSKDDEAGREWRFTGKPHDLGTDGDGDGITTLTVAWLGGPGAATAPAGPAVLEEDQEEALEALGAATAASGIANHTGVPKGCIAVRRAEWQANWLGKPTDAKRKKLDRMRAKLRGLGVIGDDGAVVWVAPEWNNHEAYMRGTNSGETS